MQQHNHTVICAARSKQLQLSQIKQRTRERQQNTLIRQDLAEGERGGARVAVPATGETDYMSFLHADLRAVFVQLQTLHMTDADLIVRHPASAQALQYDPQVFTAETRRRYVTF